jgi:hypothetical protein
MESNPEPNAGPNAGPVARLLIVLLVKVKNNNYLGRLWKSSPGLMTVFDWCIKVTPGGSLSEANAMRFVAQHTSVPVPRVHWVFVHKGKTYLVMSKIKGKMAWYGWESRTQQSKAKILSQLRQMTVELRSVPPPEGTRVSSVDNGPFYDCRLPSKDSWGPYDTVRDFHEALANDSPLETDSSNLPVDMSELFAFYRQAGNQLVLTHGDLNSLNIMVEGDEVTGIVDWETAGWFPAYWEYTCAKNVNFRNQFWADEVDVFLEPRPYELKMEKIRQRYFGAF